MKNSKINYNIDNDFLASAQPADVTTLDFSGKGAPYKFTKHVIEDSYNNRKDILKVAKNAAGVYLFLTPSGGLYVGSSIELYARVVSYFRPSTLLKADRHVLYHFNKHGFQNLTLVLLIMEPGATITEVRELEQYYVSTLCPNLNEHETVVRSGMVSPLGNKVFIYDNKTSRLVFMSNSVLYLLNNLRITGLTLRNCAKTGNLYLNRFIFTYEPIGKGYTENLISIEDLAKLFDLERSKYEVQSSEVQPNRRMILAENLKDPRLTKEYPSVIKTAAALNCSPGTILNYLKGSATGKLFLNQWKFTEISKI